MPPQPAQQPLLPLSQRLSKVVLSLQFLWFVGHLTTVINTALFVVFSRFTSGGGSRTYYKAYYGTILSYGIILFKAHGTPQLRRAYLQQILMDENTQYLLLAVIWLTSRPIWVTLIPFATFSTFHTLTFLRHDILPSIFPPTTTFSFARTVSSRIGQFITTYQTAALSFVAYVEVYLLTPYIVLSIFFGGATIMTPVLFAQFLRFRYFFSPMTKEAFWDLQRRLDALTSDPRVPPWVKGLYIKARDMVIRHGNVEGDMFRAEQQQPAPRQ